ncbi:MAG: [LysW]-aminoadipate/[LysW]-glutamate kinase [Candidatus Nezhaarchaeota archaeon]|nr:[LysW]-aminoadipate/[LysW]-glutamate kinase [Candidatus Nezhaarchaeota archaeon]
MLVVKVGGDLVKDEAAMQRILRDIKEVASEQRVVLVHGGGDVVTEVAAKLGKEQVFVTSPEGFKSRYTDRETAEIYSMVMSGLINKRLVTCLQRLGLKAVGLSGLDAGLLRAERKKKLIIIDERGRKRAIEGGYTGRIVAVNTSILEELLKLDFLPVVAPVALGDEYEILNVDGDRAAAHIAGALRAELVLLTDVEGVVVDGRVVREVKGEEVEGLLKKLGPGMITKVYAASEALSLGSPRVVIASGLKERPVSTALAGGGTRLTPSRG